MLWKRDKNEPKFVPNMGDIDEPWKQPELTFCTFVSCSEVVCDH